MRAFATFRTPSRDSVEIAPGEFIGRSDFACICIEDPRVSEAHAMLSLRGQSLMLLALRGRFRIHGEVSAETELRDGLVVELAPGLKLECMSVVIPDVLPGLEAEGLPPFLLNGTTSFYGSNPPRVERGYRPDSDGVFWTTGPRWKLTIPNEAPRTIELGESAVLGGTRVKLVSMPTRTAGLTRTRERSRVPLVIDISGDTVRILREGEETEMLAGIPGRILSALVASNGSIHWRDVIAEVWPSDQSLESALRKRFDTGLARLRQRLAPFVDDGEELVSLDGAGVLVLRLTADDRIQGGE